MVAAVARFWSEGGGGGGGCGLQTPPLAFQTREGLVVVVVVAQNKSGAMFRMNKQGHMITHLTGNFVPGYP